MLPSSVLVLKPIKVRWFAEKHCGGCLWGITQRGCWARGLGKTGVNHAPDCTIWWNSLGTAAGLTRRMEASMRVLKVSTVGITPSLPISASMPKASCKRDHGCLGGLGQLGLGFRVLGQYAAAVWAAHVENLMHS